MQPTQDPVGSLGLVLTTPITSLIAGAIARRPERLGQPEEGHVHG